MSFKKNVYKWHRKVSIIIAFPVLIWAVSGFLHPIMTDIRPHIATQKTPLVTLDSQSLKLPLQAVLKQNKIKNFFNFRVVSFDNNMYYQVKLNATSSPNYYSATTGKLLPNGDELYAQYLALQYLTNGKEKVPVEDVEKVTNFTGEYNNINKLLPVYRVRFKRADGIRVFVDAEQSRFSYASDKNRAWLNSAFVFLHTWSWLNNLNWLKVVIITILMLLTLATVFMGLYIFFNTKSKDVPGNKTIQRRRRHRFTAVFASLFTVLFAFSGCVHILISQVKDNRGEIISQQKVQTAQANLDVNKALQIIGQPVNDLSLVEMNHQLYLRCVVQDTMANSKKDLMMQMSVAVPKIYFLHLPDYSILKNGDKLYAGYLAANYLQTNEKVSEISVISKFGYDYDFADKVLPVDKILFNNETDKAVYVETSTGKLRKQASKLEDFDAYCFAFFHKHEFMAWGGKNVKDFSTMFWVSVQIVMIVFGLILYFKRKKKK